MKKRLFAVLVVMALIMSIIPVSVFADSSERFVVELTGLSVDTTEAVRPGIVHVGIDIAPVDFGIVKIQIRFISPDCRYFTSEYSLEKAEYGDKTINYNLVIDSNQQKGVFEFYEITFIDIRGEKSTVCFDPVGVLFSDDPDKRDINDFAYYNSTDDLLIISPKINIVDEFDFSLYSSLSNPALITKLNSLTNESAARIMVDDDSDYIVPQAVFNAIKGKDITLVLYRDAYQWVINGLDIVNASKDVCLLLMIEQVDKSVYGTSEDVVRLTFRPNGVLPCRCQIRIKSDYLYELYGIKGRLYMYYNNNGRLELEDDPEFDLVFDGTDKWCYLNVDHNSEFIISGSKINSSSSQSLLSPTPTSNPQATNTATPTARPISTPTTKPTTNSEPAEAGQSGIADFVERLYTVALGRPSDPYGKADWVNRVRSEGYTGADLARGFLFSDEFLGKSMSNSEFLDVLYETFFNRPADEHKADWLGLMDSGWTKTQVIDGFINSTEWANLCLTFGVASGSTFKPNITVEPSQGVIDFATRLYTTCLGREPDPAGLADWSSQLANMQISGSDAAYGFFTSAEFVNAGHSDAEYVTRLYRTFMGREPDEGGFNNWMAALASGQSREFVFQGFAGSAEWAGICADYGILR